MCVWLIELVYPLPKNMGLRTDKYESFSMNPHCVAPHFQDVGIIRMTHTRDLKVLTLCNMTAFQSQPIV